MAISTRLEDRIFWITLDRPDRLNAFNLEMGDALEAAFVEAGRNDGVGAVIVTGAGKAFCAGADLTRPGNVFALDEGLSPSVAELRESLEDPDMIAGVRDRGGRVALAIDACRKPVIAAINGVAVGVGATLPLAMDFRMASSEARFGFVFPRLGVVPEACSTWFLPRLVGQQQALEWCLTGDIFDADAACRSGLVRSIHAPDRLLADAEAFARTLITDRSPAAIALTRHMLRRNPAFAQPTEAHVVESLAMLAMSRADGREGVAAFLEKRRPRFSDLASRLPAGAEELL